MRPSTSLPRALLAACLFVPIGATATSGLVTHAERTGFQETGRYAETIALCEQFAAAYPHAVRCETFGTTPLGLSAMYPADFCSRLAKSSARNSCSMPSSISSQCTSRLAAPGE